MQFENVYQQHNSTTSSLMQPMPSMESENNNLSIKQLQGNDNTSIGQHIATGENQINIAQTHQSSKSYEVTDHTDQSLSQEQIDSAKNELSNAINACGKIAKQSEISSEAKAVYQSLSDILVAATHEIGNDFSTDNIGNALNAVLTNINDLSTIDGGTGTVGMYKEEIDGTERRHPEDNPVKTKNGYPAPHAWYGQSPIMLGQKECLTRTSKLKEIQASEHPQNMESVDFEAATRESSKGLDTYKFIDGTTYFCEKDFNPSVYSAQLARESNTFSGKVHIHKLEPGTVLVRVFGQGQTIKGSCWCRLDDEKSSVTCATDLYAKLAVKAEWNGDGNMGVFIVPSDQTIWVAEGTIASQTAEYFKEVEKDEGNILQKQHVLYGGGGTQLNILTPNTSPTEKTYSKFAGIDPKVFNQCMFCFRNDGIMKEFSENQENN